MQASQRQPFKLCHIFEKRQEFIWGFDDDSELEDGPCQSGLLWQPALKMPSIQEKASLTKIGSDLPSCSQQVCSAEEIDWQGSSSHAEKKGESNGYSHHATEGRNSSPGLAHRSSRGNSQQPAGVEDWSCRQVQPRSRSYPHQHAQYRHDKRDSSQATKMYILMQNTKLNEMGSASQTKKCNNRRESTPSPVQQKFSRHRVAVVAHPSELNTNQDREHQPLQLPVRPTGRQEIYKGRNEYRRRRIGVCRETDETKDHRMFVRVLRKRF